jgi:L,D-transpeptidase YbiS
VKATAPAVRLNVSLRDQTLVFRDLTGHTAVYSVSTALKGPGCESGSCCTPVGLHRVRLKIGQDCPVGAVFVSRRPTGEIFSEELRNSCFTWMYSHEKCRYRGFVRSRSKRCQRQHRAIDFSPRAGRREHRDPT